MSHAVLEEVDRLIPAEHEAARALQILHVVTLTSLLSHLKV